MLVARQAGQIGAQAEQLGAQAEQITTLTTRVATLDAANEALADQPARLELLLSRISGNSSAPPSEDDGPGKNPPKPKQKEGRGGPGRSRGKQPGAPGTHLAWSDDPDERADRFPQGRCRTECRDRGRHAGPRRRPAGPAGRPDPGLVVMAYAVSMDETPIRVGPRTPRPGRKKAEKYLLVACTDLHTPYLLGDRDLDTFQAFVLSDLADDTVVDRHDPRRSGIR